MLPDFLEHALNEHCLARSLDNHEKKISSHHFQPRVVLRRWEMDSQSGSPEHRKVSVERCSLMSGRSGRRVRRAEAMTAFLGGLSGTRLPALSYLLPCLLRFLSAPRSHSPAPALPPPGQICRTRYPVLSPASTGLTFPPIPRRLFSLHVRRPRLDHVDLHFPRFEAPEVDTAGPAEIRPFSTTRFPFLVVARTVRQWFLFLIYRRSFELLWLGQLV